VCLSCWPSFLHKTQEEPASNHAPAQRTWRNRAPSRSRIRQTRRNLVSSTFSESATRISSGARRIQQWRVRDPCILCSLTYARVLSSTANAIYVREEERRRELSTISANELRHTFRPIEEFYCHWFFTSCMTCADFFGGFTFWHGARANRGLAEGRARETAAEAGALSRHRPRRSRPVRAPKRGGMFDRL